MRILKYIFIFLLMTCEGFALQKVVLISGATSGIGLATAKAFCEKGWKVWAGYRQNMPEELRQMDGIRLIRLDVTYDHLVKEAVEAIIMEDGRIDVLINNAGYGLIGAEECVTIEEVQRLFDVNFFGVLRLTQAVLPSMRQQRSGHILNISSGVGVHSLPGLGLYSASKFALEGFSESLAATVSPWNIKVSIIEPGFVKNSWGQHCIVGSRQCQEDHYTKLTKGICEMLSVPQGQPCEEVAALLVKIAEMAQPDVRYQTNTEMKEYVAEKLIDPTGNTMQEQNKEFINNIVNGQKSDSGLLDDPNFKSFIDEFNEHVEAFSHLPFSEQRKLDAQFLLKHNKCCESIHRIEDLEISGEDSNEIPLRIYIPNESKNLPVMLYFHGGGWVFGGIEESDAVCRRLANYCSCIVASVEYRLAPEFPFPKPLEDCYAATKWMAQNAHNFGGNGKIIVSGESAGGNLAAAVALMARNRKGPKLAAQLLMYPVISSTIQDVVYDRCADQCFITKDAMKFFWDMYIQSSGEYKNPYASLDYNSDLKNLPPAIIITAEYDPLSYDSDKYSMQLEQASVRVIKKSFPKLIHGFLYIPLYEEKQKVEWTKEIGTSLHELGIF